MDASLLEMGLKMSIALGAVLLTFAAAIFLVKKFSGASSKLGLANKSKNKPKPIEILSYKTLGPGRNIYLVRANGKTLLLGSTAQNISQLAEYDEMEDDESPSNFESSLQEKEESQQEGGLKKQLGSKLREIARV